MAKETKSFLDIFFDFDDAVEWRSGIIEEHFIGYDFGEWEIIEDEIKLMPSGGYRAGMIIKKIKKQLELFGAEQDA